MAVITDLLASATESRDYYEFELNPDSLIGLNPDYSTVEFISDTFPPGFYKPASFSSFFYKVSNTKYRLYKSDVIYKRGYSSVNHDMILQVGADDGNTHRTAPVPVVYPYTVANHTRSCNLPGGGYITLNGTFLNDVGAHRTNFLAATGKSLNSSGIFIDYTFCQPFLQLIEGRASYSLGWFGKSTKTWKWQVFTVDSMAPWYMPQGFFEMEGQTIFQGGGIVFSDPNISYAHFCPVPGGGGAAIACVKSANKVDLVFKRTEDLQNWPTDSEWVVIREDIANDFYGLNFDGKEFYIPALGETSLYRSTDGGKTWP